MALLKTTAERWLRLVLAAALCVPFYVPLCMPLFMPMIGRAADLGSADEYRVKAAFLLNFLKFAQWPDPDGTKDPFVIGVLLPDPFTAELDDAARAMNISGRRVEVRRFRKLTDVRRCHILFVPRDADVLGADLAQAGRLTVGETPQFLSSGGIVSFYLQDNQVRFEIDPAAAERAGVRINAHVLQLGARR
jgi:hypothetical protein